MTRLGASSFRSVADMWHHRVGSTPDTTAMIFRQGGRWTSYTWREAHARMERIANALLAFGLVAEQRCCILADTSVEWVLADIAILCAGGATTTIYPSSTRDECAYICDDCDAVIVFCDTEAQVAKLRTVRDRIPQVKRVVVFRGTPSDDGWVQPLSMFEREGREWGLANPEAFAAAHADIGSERLATLMYTSGTTGQPKGVRLCHDAWVYEGEAIDALGVMTPADKQFLFLPLAHVFAKVLEVSFIRLGIPTVIDGSSDDLIDNLAATQPTTMAAVPRVFEKVYATIQAEVLRAGPANRALFRWALRIGREMSRARQADRSPGIGLRLRFALADRLVFGRIKEHFGGRIRFFISGGAPLSREIAEFFHAVDVLILEGYGLTESSAASCVNRPESYRFGSVGLPLPGCEVRVVEDGEILIRSRGVMEGYHERPEDTREALTDDGWLRTGDIGQILDSGHVVITGRKKDIIVTSGGKNIAPAQFQGRLESRCPYVTHVLMHGDRRPFCVALVAIDEEVVGAWARDHRVPFDDLADLASQPEVHDLIMSYVDQVNEDLPPFEQVKRIAVLPDALSVHDGSLTPTLKIKRAVVEERYGELLDALYPPGLVSSIA